MPDQSFRFALPKTVPSFDFARLVISHLTCCSNLHAIHFSRFMESECRVSWKSDDCWNVDRTELIEECTAYLPSLRIVTIEGASDIEVDRLDHAFGVTGTRRHINFYGHDHVHMAWESPRSQTLIWTSVGTSRFRKIPWIHMGRMFTTLTLWHSNFFLYYSHFHCLGLSPCRLMKCCQRKDCICLKATPSADGRLFSKQVDSGDQRIEDKKLWVYNTSRSKRYDLLL